MKANGNKGDFLDNKWVKRISYSFAIFLMFMMIYNVIKSKNIPGEGELIIVFICFGYLVSDQIIKKRKSKDHL